MNFCCINNIRQSLIYTTDRNQLTHLDLSNNKLIYLLRCFSNQLTQLDLTMNDSLEQLLCNHNRLNELILPNTRKLLYLRCNNNQLPNLDISNNSELQSLDCSYNKISNIDLSNNSELYELYCSRNNLRSIDLSINSKLLALICSNNSLEELDISKNTNLRYVICDTNEIQHLYLNEESKAYRLDAIFCSYNQLTSLDLTKQPLRQLQCSNNKLKILNLRNGFNYTMFNTVGDYAVDASNNPDLYCIQIDSDFIPDSSRWKWLKDEHAVYSEDCGYTSVEEQLLPKVSFSIVPNPASEFVMIESDMIDSEIEIFNLFGEKVLVVSSNLPADVSMLPSGVYFVRSRFGIEKLIVE